MVKIICFINNKFINKINIKLIYLYKNNNIKIKYKN